MTYKLNPCRYCQSADVTVCMSHSCYFVYCTECEANGAHVTDELQGDEEERAVTLWNKHNPGPVTVITGTMVVDSFNPENIKHLLGNPDLTYAQIQVKFPVGTSVNIPPIGTGVVSEYQPTQVRIDFGGTVGFVPELMFTKYVNLIWNAKGML